MRLFSPRKHKIAELQSLTDEQLIARYSRSGDPECMGLLYERYTHLVFGLCMKYLGNDAEAEDMVMLVFEKLFTELRKSEVANFRGWLYTVAKNQCLMHLRRRRGIEKDKDALLRHLKAELMETEEAGHLIPGADPVGDLVLLESAILHLNEAQQKCIEMFYLREQSYKDVSEETGYPLNEVKSHIQNGKRNLRIYIEKARK